MNKKLKPCPFCGGEATIYNFLDGSRVYCLSCGAKTATYEDESSEFAMGGFHSNFPGERHMTRPAIDGIKLAVDAWNRRVADD